MRIGLFYVVRDTGIPAHMPPRTRDELVQRRLQMEDMRYTIIKAAAQLPEDPERALQTLMASEADTRSHEDH